MEYVRVKDPLGRIRHYVVLDDDYWRVGTVHREPPRADDDDEPRRWWAERNDGQPLVDPATGEIRTFPTRPDAADALLRVPQ